MLRKVILPIIGLLLILVIIAYALGWFTASPPDLPEVPETTQEGEMPLTPEGEAEPLPGADTAPAEN